VVHSGRKYKPVKPHNAMAALLAASVDVGAVIDAAVTSLAGDAAAKAAAAAFVADMPAGWTAAVPKGAEGDRLALALLLNDTLERLQPRALMTAWHAAGVDTAACATAEGAKATVAANFPAAALIAARPSLAPLAPIKKIPVQWVNGLSWFDNFAQEALPAMDALRAAGGNTLRRCMTAAGREDTAYLDKHVEFLRKCLKDAASEEGIPRYNTRAVGQAAVLAAVAAHLHGTLPRAHLKVGADGAPTEALLLYAAFKLYNAPISPEHFAYLLCYNTRESDWGREDAVSNVAYMLDMMADMEDYDSWVDSWIEDAEVEGAGGGTLPTAARLPNMTDDFYIPTWPSLLEAMDEAIEEEEARLRAEAEEMGEGEESGDEDSTSDFEA